MNLGSSQLQGNRIQQALQARYSPFPELTMEGLSRNLNEFRIGHLRPGALAWEIMLERDGELFGAASKRFSDAARTPWRIRRTEDSRQAQRHADALTYFYTHLTATSALDQCERGGLELLAEQMMSAHAHRYSVHELVLRVDNAARREVTATFTHCPVWFFENRRGFLGYLPSEGAWEGRPLVPGEWLTMCGQGLMRQCSIAYGVKWFPLRDWLLFSSRFGLPGIQGKTTAAKDSPEWKAFELALLAFANDWVTLTNNDASITLIEAAKGSSALPFQELVERTDRLYARLFRGGDLSTQSRAGDVAGASLQGNEGEKLLAGDVARLAGVLNAGVDEPLIAYLFKERPLAWIEFTPPKPPQTEGVVKAYGFLADRGGRVAIKDAADALQVPLAAEDETDLLQPAVSTTTPLTPPMLANVLANASLLPRPPGGEGRGEGARGQVLAALTQDLAPLVARLKVIEAIEDAGVQAAKRAELLADWDRLTRSLTADPTLARALGAQAGFSGLAGRVRGAEVANANENHDEVGRFASGPGVAAAKAKVRDFLDQRGDEVAYAAVAPGVAAKIKAATGLDVSGYQHLIDRDALVHIDRQHGVGKEEQPGHLPITRDDIERIPEIVSTPDSVSNGGKSARGRSTVKYAKRLAGTTYYIEEVWTHDRVLAAKTMWKESAPGNSATPRGGVSHTSETFGAGGNKP